MGGGNGLGGGGGGLGGDGGGDGGGGVIGAGGLRSRQLIQYSSLRVSAVQHCPFL